MVAVFPSRRAQRQGWISDCLPMLTELQQRYTLETTSIEVAGFVWELIRPRSADDLISEADFDKDGRLPYWAEVWPSSIVLAERIAREASGDRRLIELGGGIGLAALVAAQSGFDSTATDYYPEALEFTALNAQKHGVSSLVTRMVDWRSMPDDLGKFDVVCAADVLYERPNGELISAALTRLLSIDGLALVTDPGRSIAAGFPDVCRQHHLVVARHDRMPFRQGKTDLHVDLYEIRRAK